MIDPIRSYIYMIYTSIVLYLPAITRQSHNHSDSLDSVPIAAENIPAQVSSPSGEASSETGCFMAYLPDYPDCNGYESVGYACVDDYCAYAGNECRGSCRVCAVFYPKAVLDEDNARCVPPVRPPLTWISPELQVGAIFPSDTCETTVVF